VSLPITGSLPRVEVVAVARKKLAIGPLMGLGAAAGLLAATQLGPPEEVARLGLPLMLAGAAFGAVWSFWRLPDARVCRAPRLLGGCGGSGTVQDTAGNSRPKPPCWAHRDGKPKRLVNLAIVAAEIAVAVALVAVLVSVAP